MAGIMKDGKVYGGTVPDDHIKNVASEDLDKKVDKTQIVTSLSSTSTDIQVPSAKSVYDFIDSLKITDEHIKEVASKDLIKIFKCSSSSITMSNIENKEVITNTTNSIPTGYRVIGVVGFWSGHGDICFSGCELRGNNWHAQIRNTYEGSKTFTLTGTFLAIPV